MNRPLRIALIGNIIREYSAFVLGVRQGIFLLGHQYRGIDFRMSSIKFMTMLLEEFKPDYIFTHMILNEKIGKTPQTLDMLREIKEKFGTRVIHTMQDARDDSRYPHDISRGVDIGLLNQTQNLNRFEKTWKIPCYYWPYGCLKQDKIAEPVNKLEYKFIYTGNVEKGIYEERTKFVFDIQDQIPGLKITKTQARGDLRSRTPELAASATAVLGVGLRYDIGGYIDVRPFQYLGAGALLITHEYKGMSRVFEYGKHLVVFNGYDVDTVKMLLEYYVENKEEATRIRKDGFEYTQRCHNYTIRVGDVIDVLEGRRDRPRVFMEDFD